MTVDEGPDLPLREQARVVQSTFELMRFHPRDFVLPVAAGVGATFMRLTVLALFVPMVSVLLGLESARLDRIMPSGMESDSRPLALMLAFAIAGAAGANAVLSYLSNRSMEERIESARAQLNELVLGSALRLGLQYYDLQRIGRAHKRVQKISSRGVRVLTVSHRILVSAASLGLYLTAMAWIAPLLAAAAIGVLAVYLLAFGRMSNRLEGLDDRVGEVEDEASAVASDLFRNLPLVKLASAEAQEVESQSRFTREAGEARQDEKRVESMLDRLRDFLSIMVVLLFAAGLSLTVDDLAGEDVSVYVIFLLIFRRSMRHFSRILNIRSEWGKSVQRAQDVLDTLYHRERFIVPSGTHALAGLGRGIEIRHLDFSYLTRPKKLVDSSVVLRDVSLEIPAGERTYIVGATGSGKSTLLRLLLRQYDCPSETIFLADRDIRDYETKSLLSNIAFAGSDPLFFDSSIRHNVSYGLTGVTDVEIREAAQKAQALDFIESFERGIDEPIGDRGMLLSSGERQRLALIRVFLRNSSLILLDEAFSALDSATEAEVLAALEEHARDRTLVMVAHRLSNLRSHDRVIVLHRGQVVETGRRDDLLLTGKKLAELWRVQGLPLPEAAPPTGRAAG